MKIADFGAARLYDAERIAALDVTVQGFADGGNLTQAVGTAQYLAPEVGPGRPPTTLADIYSLGIVLFQLLCGDFREVPSPGWEKRINDPLLEQDIARAANIDPTKRFNSAADLAINLRTLATRHAKAAQERAQQRAKDESLLAAQQAELDSRRQLAERDARRPWVVAALVLLAAGFGMSTWFYIQARQQQAKTDKVYGFLVHDVLGQANPSTGHRSDETLQQAVLEAATGIDRQFPQEPRIAAPLHDAVANALGSLLDLR